MVRPANTVTAHAHQRILSGSSALSPIIHTNPATSAAAEWLGNPCKKRLSATSSKVENHRDEDGDRRVIQAAIHRLHDRVEAGTQRSGREKIREQVDAAAADAVLGERPLLLVIPHGEQPSS